MFRTTMCGMCEKDTQSLNTICFKNQYIQKSIHLLTDIQTLSVHIHMKN